MAEAQVSEEQGQDVVAKLAEYERKLQSKDAELETYKTLVAKLEQEVDKAQKQLLKWTKDAEEIESLKTESEKTLTKAKSIIFERTKVIKNQELQIEAYNQQIESLKDVVRITKDLLEIRNLEVKQLETKINCMEEKMKAEKERQDLLHKKLETMIRHNGELKREYEAQLCLFAALREKYSERELARGVIADMRQDIQREREETAAAAAPAENGVKEEEDKAGNSTENADPPPKTE
ncbi:hypothetical protein NQ318_013777 [Aromia moschata]|uniref:Uncharacterized protein n=1 Tax=Aromia moschata TaxID=1265417 RepID=A0AAV8Z926_9CUCU|nr:hypothetical protein NQ318_013777 [Aromia moschata]